MKQMPQSKFKKIPEITMCQEYFQVCEVDTRITGKEFLKKHDSVKLRLMGKLSMYQSQQYTEIIRRSRS